MYVNKRSINIQGRYLFHCPLPKDPNPFPGTFYIYLNKKSKLYPSYELCLTLALFNSAINQISKNVFSSYK